MQESGEDHFVLVGVVVLEVVGVVGVAFREESDMAIEGCSQQSAISPQGLN